MLGSDRYVTELIIRREYLDETTAKYWAISWSSLNLGSRSPSEAGEGLRISRMIRFDCNKE